MPDASERAYSANQSLSCGAILTACKAGGFAVDADATIDAPTFPTRAAEMIGTNQKRHAFAGDAGG